MVLADQLQRRLQWHGKVVANLVASNGSDTLGRAQQQTGRTADFGNETTSLRNIGTMNIMNGQGAAKKRGWEDENSKEREVNVYILNSLDISQIWESGRDD
jgi:hypothetical protein